MIAVTINWRTLRSVRRLLVTASVVPSSPILVILMKEVLSSSEKSVLTRATRRNIPEDAILHGHRRENLKSYILVNSWKEIQSRVLNKGNKWGINFQQFNFPIEALYINYLLHIPAFCHQQARTFTSHIAIHNIYRKNGT
jgi:hypothetical protein